MKDGAELSRMAAAAKSAFHKNLKKKNTLQLKSLWRGIDMHPSLCYNEDRDKAAHLSLQFKEVKEWIYSESRRSDCF